MTAVIETSGLGKRYRRQWALTDCTLSIPAGHVVGLVGPNGAGKTTLLNLAVGLLAPTAGTIEVLGGMPAAGQAQLARVGFLAQDAPVYAGLSVADHLKLGAHLNPGWDAGLARSRIDRLDLDPGQKAGTLSGGQRAQLALTLAVAKRPELLILDEPVASLDPLARREFLQDLMEAVAEQELSVVLSSHLVADLERVCDYLIVLVGSRVRVAGPVEELLATHHLLSGPRRDPATLPDGLEVISASHTDVQTTLLVRTSGPVLDPAWTVSEVGLEDLVLAYMSQATGAAAATTTATWRYEMIWLTWRQFRPQAVTAAAALAVFAILLAATGPHLASLYAASGITGCHGGILRDRGQPLPQPAGRHQPVLGRVPARHRAHPCRARDHRHLLGRPVDRPRVRDPDVRPGLEPEHHPHPVARGQAHADRPGRHGRHRGAQPDVRLVGESDRQGPRSRRRRGLSKPFTGGRLSSWIFATHGITPLGYAAFAFALGTAAGALTRRTVPAMAITLAIFAAAQVAMPLWVRPHLIPPDRTVVSGPSFFESAGLSVGTLEASSVPGQPEAWILSSGAVNAVGQPVSMIPAPCNSPSAGKGASPNAGACMARRGIREDITYQPTSRYWGFQWIETGIFLALALALAGFCFWRLGRRPDLTCLPVIRTSRSSLPGRFRRGWRGTRPRRAGQPAARCPTRGSRTSRR